MCTCNYAKSLEKWDTLEIVCPGRTDGNPFTDYTIFGTFTSKSESKTVRGFYDGDGTYIVRFMPSFEEDYSFTVSGSFSGQAYTGRFTVTPPTGSNHGPVHVADTFHFAYADGTPHFSFGTTCYVWELQSDELVARTLETLKSAPFNKIRFCIFPKHYDYNLREPRSYPFEGTPMDSSVLTKENFFQYDGACEGNHWDFTRFNPAHFRHIERCILKLRALGIEADLIVMHPYDRWGFSCMSAKQDAFYWRYVIARLSAYRNVWWSLANEYDLMRRKTIADWERIGALICAEDPYNHLRSIHNCIPFYDHTRPWITHASIQRQDYYRTTEFVNDWRVQFGKPIVCDEIAYEGNIQHGWGNIGPQELVRRFWEGTLRGGYVGHGETYLHPDDILWWSHGGELHGESPARIGFLRRIIEELPCGLKTIPSFGETIAVLDSMAYRSPRSVNPYRLHYFGLARPSFRDFHLEGDAQFRVDVIDTWNMTITDAGIHQGNFRIQLPGREYMAVRLKKVA